MRPLITSLVLLTLVWRLPTAFHWAANKTEAVFSKNSNLTNLLRTTPEGRVKEAEREKFEMHRNVEESAAALIAGGLIAGGYLMSCRRSADPKP